MPSPTYLFDTSKAVVQLVEPSSGLSLKDVLGWLVQGFFTFLAFTLGLLADDLKRWWMLRRATKKLIVSDIRPTRGLHRIRITNGSNIILHNVYARLWIKHNLTDLFEGSRKPIYSSRYLDVVMEESTLWNEKSGGAYRQKTDLGARQSQELILFKEGQRFSWSASRSMYKIRVQNGKSSSGDVDGNDRKLLIIPSLETLNPNDPKAQDLAWLRHGDFLAYVEIYSDETSPVAWELFFDSSQPRLVSRKPVDSSLFRVELTDWRTQQYITYNAEFTEPQTASAGDPTE